MNWTKISSIKYHAPSRARPAFCAFHCFLVPYQPPEISPYSGRRQPVAVSRASAKSGRAERHSKATPHTAKPTKPRKSHRWGAPKGTSNHRVRRTSKSVPATAVLNMGGIANIRGMNRMILTTPTTANSSATRDTGRRQWLLVKRKAQAASGAAPVTIKIKEKTPA